MGVPVMYQGSKYKPRPLVAIPAPATPHFVSAEIGNVDNSTVVVTFDRDVQAAENDWLFGVTITFNGNPTGLIAGFRQANHAVVYYDLVAGATNTDVLTWAYDGTGFVVSEADSTPLAAVTAQAVTNNVAPSGPVPLLDLEADVLTLGALATWIGEEPDHHTFTQVDEAAQPTVIIRGGKKTVYFNPFVNSQYMVGPDFADNLSDFYVVCVAEFDDTINYDTEVIAKLGDIFTGTGWALDIFFNAGEGEILPSINSALNLQNISDSGKAWQALKVKNVAINQRAVFSGCYLGSNTGHAWVNSDNSSESISGTIGNYATSEPMRLGTSAGAIVTGSFSGWISAVRIYAPTPNDTDRAAIEAELAARYGVTL